MTAEAGDGNTRSSGLIPVCWATPYGLDMGSGEAVIVGAGFTGLIAARVVQAAGLQVRVVDKAMRPGGRLSSRRAGTQLVDTGVTSFNVADDEVLRTLKGLAKFSVDESQDGWRVSWNGSAQEVAVQLAGDVAIENMLVTHLSVRDELMGVGSFGGAGEIPAAQVILTMPTPQSRMLLQRSHLAAPGALQGVEYAPRLVLVASVRGKDPQLGATPEVFESATLTDRGNDDWQLVAQVRAAHSAARWEVDATHTLSELLREASCMLEGAAVIAAECKRWRYATASTVHASSTFIAADDAPVLVGGDGFGSPPGPDWSVERACRSGLDMAAWMLGR